jgi:hypothetical protein
MISIHSGMVYMACSYVVPIHDLEKNISEIVSEVFGF